MDDMMWYLLGLANGRGGKVKPITITENGTYNVSDAEKAEGYVGFAPVTVDVPDRYQEGYEDGQKHGKYTFPDGTSYSDVVNIIGGDAVADETLGVQVRTTETYGEDMYSTQTIVYDLSGNPLSTLRSWGFANSFLPTWGMPKVTYFSVTDSTTGAWKIIYTWDSGGTNEFTGTDTYLIGFGADGHKYSASN